MQYLILFSELRIDMHIFSYLTLNRINYISTREKSLINQLILKIVVKL